eukprot:9483553-Pyramimonas_sp.AAC.1
MLSSFWRSLPIEGEQAPVLQREVTSHLENEVAALRIRELQTALNLLEVRKEVGCRRRVAKLRDRFPVHAEGLDDHDVLRVLRGAAVTYHFSSAAK